MEDLIMPELPGSLSHRFVLGGARSGKSSYAEQLVENQSGDCLYVATATVWDAEMEDRIDEHRSRRGGRWTTYEEPLELVRCLKNIARPDATILVDCLTLWVTNLMMEGRDPDVEGAQLVASLTELDSPVVLVSNEVGLGIVPMDKMSRDFRDYAGRLHQRLAAVVPSVTFMVSGLPMQVKPSLVQSK
ncbi:bifunctional adenosylcobinamide kinase/adenosylcobinamide-phosphate guanylyltransferase [Kiloniella sp.]|uniref:bifunctional adenosylcobinamide kinase/adenosylcobinamide-phosphate guanylyltransferase n=1 Tax=Kiloniella sp. TaxID=1938587 RepID=UPI003B02E0AA